MNVDFQKTLSVLTQKLPAGDLQLSELYSAYPIVKKLYSQLIGVIYEKEYETSGKKCQKLAEALTEGCCVNNAVTLTINEPLPQIKELTATVHDHWLELIHTAIRKAAERQELPYFDKALVLIEITTPKYSDNSKLWDTSNRAINLVINNLKGIFFKDDNLEHMAFSVVGAWGNEGKTVLKIMPFDRFLKIF